MEFWFLIAGFALGSGIGSCATWIYLMNKHTGRPVQWQVMALSGALTFALLIAFVGPRF